MKNKSPDIEDNLFRKKGFFIALYSCLGAVAILALIITVANFGPAGFQAEDYDEDAAPVGVDQVEPYQSQVDEEAWFRPRESPAPPPQPEASPQPPAPPQHMPPQHVPSQEPHEPTPEPLSPEAMQTPMPPPAPPEAHAYDESYYQRPCCHLALDQSTRLVYFDAFTDTCRLLWPAYGDIAMRFSMDALIYDPTLDQFRTNDNLRIAAEEGTQVQAGAGGRVMAIGRNVVRGNYVKIDHGNGWIATYGQLADSKNVIVGEIVRPGQLIGTVGQPSLFGTKHGPHINLHVSREGTAVNPYELLVARSD